MMMSFPSQIIPELPVLFPGAQERGVTVPSDQACNCCWKDMCVTGAPLEEFAHGAGIEAAWVAEPAGGQACPLWRDTVLCRRVVCFKAVDSKRRVREGKSTDKMWGPAAHLTGAQTPHAGKEQMGPLNRQAGLRSVLGEPCRRLREWQSCASWVSTPFPEASEVQKDGVKQVESGEFHSLGAVVVLGLLDPKGHG